MTKAQNIQILERITQVSDDLRELRRVELEIATSGTASATLSASGGSKSFTRLDLDKIHNFIREKESELCRLRSRLNGSGPIRRIMFVRGI